jgi:hypothetical protein
MTKNQHYVNASIGIVAKAPDSSRHSPTSPESPRFPHPHRPATNQLQSTLVKHPPLPGPWAGRHQISLPHHPRSQPQSDRNRTQSDLLDFSRPHPQKTGALPPKRVALGKAVLSILLSKFHAAPPINSPPFRFAPPIGTLAHRERANNIHSTHPRPGQAENIHPRPGRANRVF